MRGGIYNIFLVLIPSKLNCDSCVPIKLGANSMPWVLIPRFYLFFILLLGADSKQTLGANS